MADAIKQIKIGTTIYDIATTIPNVEGLQGILDDIDAKLDYTNIAYGTCSTAAATAEKAVTISGNAKWQLATGCIIMVQFTTSNTASNVTLNVNSTGAYPIWYNNAEYTSTGTAYTGYANRVTTYMFNGTHWVWISNSYDANSTYTNAALGQGYCTCSTAAATTAKTASLSSYKLGTGGIVSVKFTNGNTASSPTLNINSTGAKSIYYRGAALTDTTMIAAGDTVTFIYSSQYHIISIDKAGVGGTGISIDKFTIKHTNSVNPDSVGEDGDTRTLAAGGSFKVPNVTYDAQGHITGTSNITLTLPGDKFHTPTVPATSAEKLTGSTGTANTKIATGTGMTDMYIPVATATKPGTTIVYPADSCTTFSSDSGTVTPAAVQKGAKMFAITRPASSTTNAITRYSNTTGDVKDSKILVEDVTNTRDSSLKAQVLSIPAEGGKKMVYGYCTDQVDGTSFIGGVFDANATEFPYTDGLAIGGTSGNLLWKGNRVLDTRDLNGDITDKIDSRLNAVDAMIYKGTLAGGSTSPGTLTPAANAGHTYKVSTAGYINGTKVEVGDMLICQKDSTTAAGSSNYATINANWNYIQTNIDGYVIGPASSTSGNFALFDGTTGKIIKNSSYSPSSFAANGHQHSLVAKGSVGEAKLTPAGSVSSSFAGTKNTHNHTFTGTAASHNHTFTGTKATISTTYTPAGTVTSTFTGTAANTGTHADKYKATVASSTHTHKYTPSGTVSQPTFTGVAATSGGPGGTTSTTSVPNSSHTHKVTAAGTVSQPTFTGTLKSTQAPAASYAVSVGSASHTHNVTATGTISSSFTGDTVDTGGTDTFATVYSITSVGSLPSLTYTAPSHTYTAPSHTYTAPSLSASYNSGTECLTITFNAGAHSFSAGTHAFEPGSATFSAGALPSRSSVKVASGLHTHAVTPTGTITSTFTGTSATSDGPSDTKTVSLSTHIHSYTPVGIVSQPTFTGSEVDTKATASTSLVSVASSSHTHSVTAQGTVSQPTFTGTEGTTTSISGTTDVSGTTHIHGVTATGNVASTFAGTEATISTEYTPAGSIANKSITPAGSISSVDITPSGSVTSTFTGNEQGHTHTFTGTSNTTSGGT